MYNDWENLQELAEQAVSQGNYTIATDLWSAALSTVTQFEGNFQEVCVTLSGMAEANFIVGKYKIAEQCYRQLVNLNENAFGRGHLKHGIALNQLANFYFLTGRNDEALQVAERVIGIFVMQLGHSHKETIASMHFFGCLLEHLGQYGQARHVYSNALKISDARWGCQSAISQSLSRRLSGLPESTTQQHNRDAQFVAGPTTHPIPGPQLV